jgi:phage tail-like protein
MAEGLTDQYKNAFNFEITFTGYEDGSGINQAFTRCSGIVSNSEAMEYMHGTDPYVRKNPGRVTFEDVTLERVYNGQDAFYAWRKLIENGGSEKYDVEVYMMDRAGNEVRHMTLVQAWPIRWELPELDASGSGPASERITLSIESVVHQDVGAAAEIAGY